MMPVAFAQLQFADPRWLWLGALAGAALIALLARAERRRRAAIRRFAAASPESSQDPRKRRLRQGLAVAGLALAAMAMARPLFGYRFEAAPHEGTDLMFAVDTSKSMRAADLRPDRLTRAKLAVADLVRRFEGERVGLIAFAGDAFVQAPLTADRGVFLEALDALDTDVIPRGGTDLASAFHAAEQAMASEPGHRKVLVLLSDGEDLAGNAIAGAREAAARGLTIHTVGVGTPGGELIQIANPAGVPALLRDENGQPVRSKLDETALRGIATATGGAYQPLGADGRGLDALYERALSQLPRGKTEDTPRKVYTERFQIPLAIALACLVAELTIGDRRRRASAARATGAVALVLALLSLPLPAAAGSEGGDAASAYNAGTETYRAGDFAAAERQFKEALRGEALRSENADLQIDSYYDLGNARYRVGQATLEQNRDATIASWRRALEAYDAALALQPKDADARFNRDLVARKLAELEKQKEREEKKQDEKKQQQGPGRKDEQQQPPQAGQGQPQPQPQDGQGKSQPQDGHGQQQPEPQPGAGKPRPQLQQDKGEQQPSPEAGQDQSGRKAEDGKGRQSKPTDEQGQTAPPKPEEGAGGEPKTDDQQHAAAGAAARADEARRAAGELTRTEADQLLDSVAGELRPMAIQGRTRARPAESRIKDW